jgi:tRNA G26 N,N-dimethylase Trm1
MRRHFRGPQHTKGNSVKFQPGAGPSVPQQCPHTGSGFLMGGPFWVEPLHDPSWITALLASVKVRSPPCADRFCSAHFFQGLSNMLSLMRLTPLGFSRDPMQLAAPRLRRHQAAKVRI